MQKSLYSVRTHEQIQPECARHVARGPSEGREQTLQAYMRRGQDENSPASLLYVFLVCDNLNTHKTASLYEAFEPAEARRLARRLDIRYTPKHGSWLNIAEVELSVLTSQCLDRRIADLETMQKEIKAWEQERNTKQSGVDWRFTTEDARIRLKRLYPHFILTGY